MKHRTFSTDRLDLIPTGLHDARLIYDLMNTPKFLQFVGDRNIKSVSDAEKYIEARMLPQLDMLGYSSYTIYRKSDQVQLGTCGLYNRDGVEGIDLGFGLLPDYEGKGYASEAAEKLVNAAFTVFNLKSLKAITDQKNLASQRLLTKLGFHQAGLTVLPGTQEELFLYELGKN